MTTTTTDLGVRGAWWTPRRSRWLLVAVHISLAAASPVITVLGLEGRPAVDAWVVAPLGLAILAIQLWHSFAAARDEQPSGWPWTLVVLGLLVYLPMWWFGWNWVFTQIFFVASVVMHVRGHTRTVMAATPILGTSVATFFAEEPLPDWQFVLSLRWLLALVVFSGILYGAVRLVRALDELYATWVELAETAVGDERSRLSRDLHDVLGQSLTAVSLKGDLALALLPSDRAAAEEEIRSLTAIARGALHDTRRVTRGHHTVSLVGEVQRAEQLLDAAGIEAHIDIAVVDLPPPVEEVLAWATREGVTNMLRHSQVNRCSITAARRDGGAVRLEILNDGAGPVTDHSGRGLAGLAERSRALSGSLSAERRPDGWFVLRIEVPDVHEVTV